MDKKDKFIQAISDYYFTIFVSLTCIQNVMFFACITLKRSNLMLHLIPIILIWTIYILFKDTTKNKKEKDISLMLLKLDTLIFFIAFINNGLLSISKKIPALSKEVLVVLILIDIMIVLISITLLINTEFNQKVKMIHETDTKSLLCKNKSNDSDIKPGDAVLGYDIETKKPVVLPFKDRFLHMLIIG